MLSMLCVGAVKEYGYVNSKQTDTRSRKGTIPQCCTGKRLRCGNEGASYMTGTHVRMSERLEWDVKIGGGRWWRRKKGVAMTRRRKANIVLFSNMEVKKMLARS